MQDQRDILRAACGYVKPGGRLVYVTCSFLMEENEDQVASFLANRKDFIGEDAAEAAARSGQLTDKGAALVRKLRRQLDRKTIIIVRTNHACYVKNFSLGLLIFFTGVQVRKPLSLFSRFDIRRRFCFIGNCFFAAC